MEKTCLINWLVVYLPLWKKGVSWDDDIPNWVEKIMFQTTKQYFMGVFQTYSLHLLMDANYSENGF